MNLFCEKSIDDIYEPVHKSMRISPSTSLSSQNESANEEHENPGFAVRPQIMIVNGLSLSGLKTINTFINGYLYLWQNNRVLTISFLKSPEERFLRVIKTINDGEIPKANKKLLEHLVFSGLCTRQMFKNIINCETDIDKVIKQIGVQISAKFICTKCDAFKYIK